MVCRSRLADPGRRRRGRVGYSDAQSTGGLTFLVSPPTLVLASRGSGFSSEVEVGVVVVPVVVPSGPPLLGCHWPLGHCDTGRHSPPTECTRRCVSSEVGPDPLLTVQGRSSVPTGQASVVRHCSRDGVPFPSHCVWGAPIPGFGRLGCQLDTLPLELWGTHSPARLRTSVRGWGTTGAPQGGQEGGCGRRLREPPRPKTTSPASRHVKCYSVFRGP